MRIREGFIKKPIMDEIVVVPTGEASETFEGMIKLNETGSLIWDLVSEGKSLDEIAKHMADKYDVDFEEAKSDAKEIIDQMTDQGFFVED